MNFINLAKSIGTEITNNKNNITNTLINERLNSMEKNITQYTIDRIEGEFAVCEKRDNKEMINIKLIDLPIEAREGSVITYENGKYILESGLQEETQKRIKEKMDKLWKTNH